MPNESFHQTLCDKVAQRRWIQTLVAYIHEIPNWNLNKPVIRFGGQVVLELIFPLSLKNISSIALSNLTPILMSHLLCNPQCIFTSWKHCWSESVTGLIRIAVFNASSFQCRNPNCFANGLVVFPRFVMAWVMKNSCFWFFSVVFLAKKSFSGAKLKGDCTISWFGFWCPSSDFALLQSEHGCSSAPDRHFANAGPWIRKFSS